MALLLPIENRDKDPQLAEQQARTSGSPNSRPPGALLPLRALHLLLLLGLHHRGIPHRTGLPPHLGLLRPRLPGLPPQLEAEGEDLPAASQLDLLALRNGDLHGDHRDYPLLDRPLQLLPPLRSGIISKGSGRARFSLPLPARRPLFKYLPVPQEAPASGHSVRNPVPGSERYSLCVAPVYKPLDWVSFMCYAYVAACLLLLLCIHTLIRRYWEKHRRPKLVEQLKADTENYFNFDANTINP